MRLDRTNKFTSMVDADGGDPWIIEKDGWYYYTKTSGYEIKLWRSRNLSFVFGGEVQEVFQNKRRLFDSIWAPELHFFEGRWVIYFAANINDSHHRSYAISNDSMDPFRGSWKFSEIKGMDDNFAIDATLLISNKNYLIWSGRETLVDETQNLYISELVNWNEVIGSRVLLSSPEFDWEKRFDCPINEGPVTVVKNNTINLVYSGSPSWENGYCLGLLTARTGTDLLNPKNWHKSKNPIFDEGNDVYSPGHNSFVTTKDGKENWMIYHSARYSHSGFKRSVRMERYGFDKNDRVMINGGKPLSSSSLQELPSGDRNIFWTPINKKLSSTRNKEEFNIVAKESGSGNFSARIFVMTKIKNPIENPEERVVTIECNERISRHSLVNSSYFQPLYFEVILTGNDNLLTVTVEGLRGELQVGWIELSSS